MAIGGVMNVATPQNMQWAADRYAKWQQLTGKKDAYYEKALANNSPLYQGDLSQMIGMWDNDIAAAERKQTSANLQNKRLDEYKTLFGSDYTGPMNDDTLYNILATKRSDAITSAQDKAYQDAGLNKPGTITVPDIRITGLDLGGGTGTATNTLTGGGGTGTTTPIATNSVGLPSGSVARTGDVTELINAVSPFADRQSISGMGLSATEQRLKRLLDDPDSIKETGAYKFRVKQGQEALNRNLAAKGLLGSGNRLTELTQYGQDMASQEYENQFGRLSGLLGKYQESGDRRLSSLLGLAGTGLSSGSNMWGQKLASDTDVFRSKLGALTDIYGTTTGAATRAADRSAASAQADRDRQAASDRQNSQNNFNQWLEQYKMNNYNSNFDISSLW